MRGVTNVASVRELKDGRTFDQVLTSEGCIIEVRGYKEIPFMPADMIAVKVTHLSWNFRDVSNSHSKTQGFEREVLKRLVLAGYRVTAQWRAGAYRIDLVVEANDKRLAVECDGDRYHPLEKLGEDMERQSILERMGWVFSRVRGSEFLPGCRSSVSTCICQARVARDTSTWRGQEG